MNNGLFTSNKDDWETPQDLFDELNKEFGFQLDPCASRENAKCDNYFTQKQGGLEQDWTIYDSVFVNPPYGRKIGLWIEKSFQTSCCGTIVVCLLPARTDTQWFHDYIYGKAEIRFLKGRLKFSNSKNSAPFPSMVVVFRKKPVLL